ncbi:MAG TPA: DUF305 domain-containing protein [Ilumatobacter sp.]|nr:DUF305 domain-containing protein [Ilumatobacter sp.]
MGAESELSLDQLIELERRAAEREAAEANRVDGDEGDDDAIVLPWWQRPFNIGLLVVTAAVLAAMIGWLVGDSGAQPRHNDVDVGFLQDMREHHEQGVLMSLMFAELADTSPDIEVVARTISRGQSVEVGRMIQLLRSFGADEARPDASGLMAWMGDHAGHGTEALDPDDYDDEFSAMPGMATSAQLDELEASSGEAADRLFVELMIAHHEAGVEMAEYASEHAANSEVVAFADGMIHGQRGEIIELQGLLD